MINGLVPDQVHQVQGMLTNRNSKIRAETVFTGRMATFLSHDRPLLETAAGNNSNDNSQTERARL